jgi:2-hydroxy-6-oxonona-2,4-dienedioate hydrolase
MPSALVIAAVFLAGAGGVVWFYFHRDMAELRGRLVGRSEVLQTAFGSMEYAQIGNGKPVLVVHGSGGGFDQSIEMAGQFAEYNYRLIAPSRFGYLRSDLPDNASPEMQAEAFAELLDKLNLERVFVFGGSAGALSALQFAIRHPERCRGLVLFVPAAFSPDRKPNETAAVGPLASSLIAAVLRSDFIFWLAVNLFPAP